MHAFSYLHLLAAQAYLILAVFVFFRDRKARLNQLCSCIFFCFFIWSFSWAFIQNPLVSSNTAAFFEKLGSFGWLFFSPLFVWFSVVYTRREQQGTVSLLIALLFTLPIVLFLGQWGGVALFSGHVLQPYGWFSPWKHSFWTYLFFATLVSNLTASLLLLTEFIKKSRSIPLKHQSIVLFASMVIPVLLGTVSNISLPLLGVWSLPPIADIFILTWAMGLTYAVNRYQLLCITPFFAAEKIIASMKDLLVLLDLQGTIVSVNRSTLQVLGYRSGELEGASIEKILGGGQDAQRIAGLLFASSGVHEYETTFVSRSGALIPVTVSTSLFPGRGIVCVAHDMSLQYLRTEQLKEEKRKLEESERMKALLTGAIAHDIKNHLFSMACDLRVVSDLLDCPADVRSILRHTTAACNAGLSLTANMLDIGKMEEGRLVVKKSVVDFPVIQEMLDRYIEHVFFSEKKIAVDVCPPVFPLCFEADHYLLDRVLQNLLTNAALYTPAGGMVRISFGEPARVCIFNSGDPIPVHYRETLFDKYARTTSKGSRYSQGLGLFFCRLVMTAHGGDIRLECTDEGNCFILDFVRSSVHTLVAKERAHH